MGYVALKEGNYCLALPDVQAIRENAEGVRSFLINRFTVAATASLPRPPSSASGSHLATEDHLTQPSTGTAVSAAAKSVQPPAPTVNSPHFEQHLKQGLRVEDLKQPPSKRAKVGGITPLGMSPDRISANLPQSPLDPVINPDNQADHGSPVSGTVTKSPGGPSVSRRTTAGRGGAAGRGSRKTSAPTRPGTKTSHQIMAEVKAEHAAAKAKAEAEAQQAKIGGASEMPPESNERPKEPLPSSSTVESFEGVTLKPQVSPAPTDFQVVTETLKSPHNPLVLIDDVMEEFWDDALLSNNMNQTLLPDFTMPTISDAVARRARDEMLLSGGWLLADMVDYSRSDSSKDHLRTDEPVPLDATVYAPFGMDALLKQSALESTIASDVAARAPVDDITVAGLHSTDWGDDILGMFFHNYAEDSSPTPGPETEVTPKKTLNDDLPTAEPSEKKVDMSDVAGPSVPPPSETPAFSPSKLSTDSTPGSLCETESAGVKKAIISESSHILNTFFGIEEEPKQPVPFEMLMTYKAVSTQPLRGEYWSRPFAAGLERPSVPTSTGSAVIAKSF